MHCPHDQAARKEDATTVGCRRSPASKPRDPKQPVLPFDPMPDRVEPCLALLVPKPPKGPQWIYEVKWDGYRLAIHVESTRVRVITRGGHDWTHRFPSIPQAASWLGGTMILDGEAVVLDGGLKISQTQRAWACQRHDVLKRKTVSHHSHRQI